MNTPALSVERVVAVIGAGAMGSGIAQVAAAAGHPVKLLDARAGAAEKAVNGIRAQFAKLVDKGRMSTDAAAAACARLSAVDALAGLADAALVVEAIVESLDAKQQLFRELESLVASDCILATNTSSISITAIGAALQRPERLAGLHFFNPAPLMALVEVVSGLATAREVADALFATAAAWGKSPVHAKSTPGFIVNRVARPYYAEALRLLQEGAADVATLDALMREAGGFRMGPFELMDMIGHDVNFAVTRSVWTAFFHDQRFLPSLIQQELVDAGFLGRKSGRGFHDYREGAARAQPSTEALRALSAVPCVHGDSAAAQALSARLDAAGVRHERDAGMDGHNSGHTNGRTNARTNGHTNSPIATVGGATLFVTDGRSATQRAAETSTPGVVLIDLALDYASASRIGIAAARQCPEPALHAAIALLQAAGLQVSLLNDVPGLAVMRTVAMLANEAADAVHQGVCSADGADAAMKLGVNYPLGPLAWAERIGVDAVRQVLVHLGAAYGEDRYRVSPRIQQAFFAKGSLHD